jgi:SAM-dependent methyltransferase
MSESADVDFVSDAVWRRLSQTAPYWSVLSMDEFANELTPATRDKFFQTGEDLVANAFARASALAPGLSSPAVAIDFGCGVGRLTRPLARRSGRVYAVDISADMLRMCLENCAEAGLRNVIPIFSTGALTGIEADLIVTSITFQHIRPSRGMLILESLLNALKIGGVAFLFILVAGASNVVPEVPDADRIQHGAKELIEMNVYPAADLITMFARFASEVHFSFVPMGGQLGADIVLRRTT